MKKFWKVGILDETFWIIKMAIDKFKQQKQEDIFSMNKV